MEQRILGSTDLRVSVLGFGCAPVGSRAGSVQSTKAIRTAFERGITYFDTADMYGMGASEQTLARVLGPHRDKIVISTKCGYTFSNRLKAIAWVKPLVRPVVMKLKGVKASAAGIMASQRSQCFDVPYIENCIHGSLSRLGTDRLDLFFLHDPPATIAGKPEVFQKLAALKQAGKLRWYGVSCDVETAIKVLDAPDTGVAVLQVAINPLEPQAMSELLTKARARNIGIIARQPFANGKIFHSEGVRSVLASRGLASDAKSIGSLALRFVRDTEGVASVLPSMMRPEHLEANLAAIGGPPLSAEERQAARMMASIPVGS